MNSLGPPRIPIYLEILEYFERPLSTEPWPPTVDQGSPVTKNVPPCPPSPTTRSTSPLSPTEGIQIGHTVQRLGQYGLLHAGRVLVEVVEDLDELVAGRAWRDGTLRVDAGAVAARAGRATVQGGRGVG